METKKIEINKDKDGIIVIKCEEKTEKINMITKELKGSQIINILNYKKDNIYEIKELSESDNKDHVCLTLYNIFNEIKNKINTLMTEN